MALLQDLLETHSCHKEWAASDILIDIGQLPPPKITQPPRQDVNSDEVRIYSFFVVVVVFQIIYSFLLIFSVLLKAQTFYYYCVCLCVYDVCVGGRCVLEGQRTSGVLPFSSRKHGLSCLCCDSHSSELDFLLVLLRLLWQHIRIQWMLLNILVRCLFS